MGSIKTADPFSHSRCPLVSSLNKNKGDAQFRFQAKTELSSNNAHLLLLLLIANDLHEASFGIFSDSSRLATTVIAKGTKKGAQS